MRHAVSVDEDDLIVGTQGDPDHFDGESKPSKCVSDVCSNGRRLSREQWTVWPSGCKRHCERQVNSRALSLLRRRRYGLARFWYDVFDGREHDECL
jgi:hypothetical protein